MTTGQWLAWLALGGFLGTIGQSLRVIAGLKKLVDQTTASKTRFRDAFDPIRLFISLFFGFIAGVLAAFTLDWKDTVDRQTALSMVVAGYAGTDFIEGFISRAKPSATTSQTSTEALPASHAV